jgi:hypothetical protein
MTNFVINSADLRARCPSAGIIHVTFAEGGAMKAILVGAAMALTITTAGAAEADRNSTGYMLPYCKKAVDIKARRAPAAAYEIGRCDGILSMLGGIFRQDMGEARTEILCTNIPEGTVLVQLIAAVSRFANAHPDSMELDFRAFALAALHDAWPCPSSEFDRRFNGK